MLLSKTVSIKWNPINKNRLINLGYKFTKMKDEVEVKVSDLKDNAKNKVELYCDYCLEKGITTITNTFYYLHVKNKKRNLKDSCEGCQAFKIKDVINQKYGVTNASYIPEVVEKIRVGKIKFKLEEISNEFKDRGFKLISNKYVSTEENLEYICLKHIDKGIQTITYSNFKNNHGCYYCGREKMALGQTGENNHSWKGGISPLQVFLRVKLINWKKASMKASNYKCVITGYVFDDIHHLYGFNLIINEVFETVNLPIYQSVKDYTDKEIQLITDTCIEIHAKYPLGVCLCKEVHELFHSIYGYGDNTPEQFEDFKNNYFNNIHSLSILTSPSKTSQIHLSVT